jgi:hypothetical protein
MRSLESEVGASGRLDRLGHWRDNCQPRVETPLMTAMPNLDAETIRLLYAIITGIAPNAAWDGIKALVRASLRGDAIANSIADTAVEYEGRFADLRPGLTAWAQTDSFRAALAVFDSGESEQEFVEAALESVGAALHLSEEVAVDDFAAVLRSLYSNLSAHTLRSENGLELLDSRLAFHFDELLRSNESIRSAQVATSALISEFVRLANAWSTAGRQAEIAASNRSFVNSHVRVGRITSTGEVVGLRIGRPSDLAPEADAIPLHVDSHADAEEVAGRLTGVDIGTRIGD